MDWFRWHHGSINDPKWRVISRRSGVGIPTVIAIWAAMLETASQADARGTLEGWVAEDIAAALDIDESDVDAVFEAMQGKVLEGELVTGWDKRQPKKEDTGAAERKRKQREKEREESGMSRNVTPCHAKSRDVTTDKIREDKRRKEKKEDQNLVGDSGESHDEQKWTDEDDRVADEILTMVQDVAPSSRKGAKWADHVRLMRERDKRTHDEILGMFRWANADSFWRVNILSPAKLREKWPQLEAKRNNNPRAGPGQQTQNDRRVEFFKELNGGRDGRHCETERVITGEATRLD